jgi:cytidine deaminase
MPVPTASQIATALSRYPWAAPAVEGVTSIVTGGRFAGVVTAEQVARLVRETSLEQPQVMLALTAVASLYAVAPISGFHVGAVACGLSGNLYLGCNLEYAGQPLSCCSHAEQGATTNAWLHGETGLTSLAVDAAPCGYCRQYLWETASAATLKIILKERTAPLTELLPFPFGPQQLGKKGRLLDPQSNRLRLATPSSDPAVLAALDAANGCYAPYTRSFAGIGVHMKDGATFRGPLAENAAYNPSQPPLEAALFALRIAGYDFTEISEVALVEVQDATVSQLEASRAVLRAVRELPIRYAPAARLPSSDGVAPG